MTKAKQQRLMKRTAAWEALQLCRKFFPWRVKQARARAIVQSIETAAKENGVKVATGFMESMLTRP